MTFQKATRAGTKALIGLYGESGSGKTFSALLLARGLAGPDGHVFMIDTENRRGEMYADEIPNGYEVSQLTAPFSSNKYAEMIGEAEAAANGEPAALVIDSFSHEWEGVGGVCSAAEALSEARAQKYNKPWNGSVQFGDWKQPKADHKRMVLKMLGSNLHIICCLRAQYKSHQVEKKDYAKHGITSNMKSTVIRDDFQTAIQDSGFIFEMTVHAELSNKAAGVPRLTKCPQMLYNAFGESKQISVETGEAIAEWTAGGSPVSPELLQSVDDAMKAATKGKQKYSDWWGKQSPTTKTFHVENGHQANCIKAANDHDNPPSSEDDGT